MNPPPSHQLPEDVQREVAELKARAGRSPSWLAKLCMAVSIALALSMGVIVVYVVQSNADNRNRDSSAAVDQVFNDCQRSNESRLSRRADIEKDRWLSIVDVEAIPYSDQEPLAKLILIRARDTARERVAKLDTDPTLQLRNCPAERAAAEAARSN